MSRRPFPPTVLRKAQRIIENGDVHRIADGLYSVRSQSYRWTRREPPKVRGLSYMVEKITSPEKWQCMCSGFKSRGICSHIIAVMLLEARKAEDKGGPPDA